MLQPVSGLLVLILALLMPAWGPFALAASMSRSLGEGTEGWADASLVLWALYSVGGLVVNSIMLLDCHPGAVRLIWRECTFSLFLKLGSRLVYTVAAISYFPRLVNVLHLLAWCVFSIHLCLEDATSVTHMMRYSPEGYRKLKGNAAAGRLLAVIYALSFLFELGRHFALLHIADDGATIELVPASVFGGAVTNVNVLNAAFSTSMLLYLRWLWVRYSSGGKQFNMIVSRVNLHPEYAAAEKDDGGL